MSIDQRRLELAKNCSYISKMLANFGKFDCAEEVMAIAHDQAQHVFDHAPSQIYRDAADLRVAEIYRTYIQIKQDKKSSARSNFRM